MALGYLQDGIKMNGHDYLSATIVHYVDMLNPLTLPSQAEFKDIYRDNVAQVLKLINGTRSKFAVSIIPFQLIIDYDLDLEFGFMDNTSNFTITDANTGLIYTNAFQFLYDSYVAAITKLVGVQDRVADRRASIGHGLRSMLIYSTIADENMQNISDGGPYQRHWGIYISNGE
ncbi:hypothetical protein M569_15735 [Genlisea aurea]|uniref:Uncharacterized protein n=1 Tax=Genlisea aurea TaxID=192259 RepID=S8BWU4_9LAMI|nr:hypothetical protein M569_15735 [Genlisea aurea]